MRLTEFASDECISGHSFGFLSFVLPLTRPMLEISKAIVGEGVIKFE